MRNLLLGTYSFLCVLGILLLAVFIPSQTPEYMGYGLPSSFLPNLLACGIIFFSAIEFVKTFLKKDDKRPSSISTKSLIHLIKVATVGLLAFPLMEMFTFIPVAIVTICAFQFICGQRNYVKMLAIAVGLTMFFYFAATYLLDISLP